MTARIDAALITLFVAVLAVSVRAQEPKTTVREVLMESARVERIDRFSRSLTLRTSQGLLHTVYVEPGLKVFDEVQSGDAVTVRVVESLVVAVRPDAKPKVIADTTAEARKENPDSGREVQQQLKATVTIESVDMQTQMVVYKTADNRRAIRAVADARLLEGLKRGDVVEITLTRERAIELRRDR